ncbi:MAG TPA: metal ABC transporter ATP-binding protein [Anaerohalosphaeraceae bacterium]|nr:metal ABC transporter ATP-binding protein [Anaerohalosphaeraceae bacterium]
MNLIEIKNVCVRYGPIEALCSISLAISAGDYVAIIGPNGSGKTTLFKAILNLLPLTEGSISLYGTDARRFTQWNKIGYVPQVSRNLHKGFPATVREIVASGILSAKSFPRMIFGKDYSKVIKAMETVGVCDLAERLIGELSGGQQQRVFLARAMVNDPDLLLLDEPTAAIDPATREQFYRTLREINTQFGKTIVLISHDASHIGHFAAKLAYLDKHLVFFGGFDQFCISPEMTRYFGPHAQHLICGQHCPMKEKQ